jgi:hypothetical protein
MTIKSYKTWINSIQNKIAKKSPAGRSHSQAGLKIVLSL